MSFSERKKEEYHFENREGIKDCEQRWRKSLRKLVSPSQSEKSKEVFDQSLGLESSRNRQKTSSEIDMKVFSKENSGGSKNIPGISGQLKAPGSASPSNG